MIAGCNALSAATNSASPGLRAALEDGGRRPRSGFRTAQRATDRQGERGDAHHCGGDAQFGADDGLPDVDQNEHEQHDEQRAGDPAQLRLEPCRTFGEQTLYRHREY